MWAQPQLTHRVDNSQITIKAYFYDFLSLEVQDGTALCPYNKVGDYNNDIKTQYSMNWHRPRSSVIDKFQKSNSNEI